MGQRSKVSKLPKVVLDWLNQTLVEGNFSGYELLESELKARGYDISKTAIHRHGQNLERRLAAVRASTEAARQIAEAAPDDADLRSQAVISLVQTELFDILISLQQVEGEDDPTERAKLIARIAKSSSELSRASVNNKKWQAEVKAKAMLAADAVEAIAKKGGLSEQALETIRRDILGIAA